MRLFSYLGMRVSFCTTFLLSCPPPQHGQSSDASYSNRITNEAICCCVLCVQPMGYGPRMQQPSSQSQFLPQTPFSTPGMNVTNMPLAPSGGQAPVSQVCLTNGFSYLFLWFFKLWSVFYREGWQPTAYSGWKHTIFKVLRTVTDIWYSEQWRDYSDRAMVL